MIILCVLFNLFALSLQVSTDVISALAAINAEGYPDSIIYDTVSKTLQKSVTQRSKEDLIEALMSSEVENQLRIAAMNYARSKLEPSLQRQLTARSFFRAQDDGSSGCSYSWWSWLPWTDCPAEKTEDAPDLNQQETYAKCFR